VDLGIDVVDVFPNVDRNTYVLHWPKGARVRIPGTGLNPLAIMCFLILARRGLCGRI
jgi:hypothetical protein